ncbi:MAG: segregation/condensation protein A [Legionellales bacterium]|nr:segregation/condensation protein A [Legionellales bacterium]
METATAAVLETHEDSAIKVAGQPLEQLPADLYIPPEALEVFLELFQGPLDLLLYLIKKQNLDILDIPIAQITHQYMQYVEIMKQVRLDLAADYLVMAAALAEIKSRMLLPRSNEEEEEEYEDPRAELVRRLQEYERFKKAAGDIESLPQVGKDTFLGMVLPPQMPEAPRPGIEMSELMNAFREVLMRIDLNATHDIQKETLSLRERMAQVLEKVNHLKFVAFGAFFSEQEGRLGVVVSFMALLELLKESLIDVVQTEAFGPIYVKAVQVEEEDDESTGTYN